MRTHLSGYSAKGIAVMIREQTKVGKFEQLLAEQAHRFGMYWPASNQEARLGSAAVESNQPFRLFPDDPRLFLSFSQVLPAFLGYSVGDACSTRQSELVRHRIHWTRVDKMCFHLSYRETGIEGAQQVKTERGHTCCLFCF